MLRKHILWWFLIISSNFVPNEQKEKKNWLFLYKDTAHRNGIGLDALSDGYHMT